jgi:general nucleoside transport system permease protein
MKKPNFLKEATKPKNRAFGTLILNVNLLSALMAIVVGMLFGLVIMLFSNPSQALDGFAAIIISPITGGSRVIGQVLYFATPLIMTGLAVGFAFKTGLFNIGASGQFTMGGYAAIMVGVYGGSLGSVHWVVGLLAALVAGGLWAFIPGLLKAYANVHEVISSIMMNYIGMYLVNYLVRKTCYNSLKNESIAVLPSADIPNMGLNYLFPGSFVNGGFIIAITAVAVIYIILQKTTFGYELKAVGYNKDAAKYAGINEKRSIIYSMMISGALSGLGGGLIYLAGTGKQYTVVDMLANEGFNGIVVALLGLSHPIGVGLAAIFIGYITVGGFNMQLYDFVPEIINIITATIIYSAACALLFKGLFNRFTKKKAGLTDLDGKPINPGPPPPEPPSPPKNAKAKNVKGGER